MMSAKRYLFITWEGGGNVAPVLAAARGMVERGCDVRVLTEPCLREAVEGIGARFVSFTKHFVRTDRNEDLLEDWKAGSPPAALARSMRNVVFGPAAYVAADAVRVLDEEPADALVVDWLLPAGVAVGEARRIPTAVLFHCPNMLPAPGRPAGPMTPATGFFGRLRDRLMWGMFRFLANRHRDAYNAMRRDLGLPPLANVMDQFGAADRVLVQTTREFDFVGDPDPDNLLYVGPVLDEPDWITATEWENPWPAEDTRPLVLLSMSTTFQDQAATMQAAITALGELEVRGLVTLGPALASASFDVPDNVKVVESAPHGAVLPHVDAFITHCGHGSLVRALVNGVPVVGLPSGRDQDGNAARVVHHGMGLSPRRNPRAIANAVREVLGDPSHRAAAQAMAEHIRRDVDADLLGSELYALGGTVAPYEAPRVAAS